MERGDFTDEDLADIILSPDDKPPNKAGKQHRRTRRLERSREFARFWLSWLKEPCWQSMLPPTARLWLVVWYRSGEGTEPIQLTKQVAKEANISRRICSRYARQLEQAKLIQVKRRGKSSLILTVRIQPPTSAL